MLLKACPGAFFALLNLIIAVKIKEAEASITIIVKVRIHSREFFKYLNMGFRKFAGDEFEFWYISVILNFLAWRWYVGGIFDHRRKCDDCNGKADGIRDERKPNFCKWAAHGADSGYVKC